MASISVTDPRRSEGSEKSASTRADDSAATSCPRPQVCAHCGLPVPEALRRTGPSESDADEQLAFCCSGCQAVYAVLRDAGLTEYYSFRERLGEDGSPAPETKAGDFGEFDSPAFRELYCQAREDGTETAELLVEGVHCAACVWLVERLPQLEPAVLSARLDMGRATVELHFDSRRAPLSQIGRALAKMGYRPRPARGRASDLMRRQELRKLLIRMGVAGASAGNVMLMAFALYSGAAGTDAFTMHEQGTMAETTRRFFQVASLVVSLPALWAGSVFFRGAFYSLKMRTPHMDLPIAIGITMGFVWGTYGAVTGSAELYFDSITALVFFLLVGRFLQRRHQMRASQAAELLSAVTPSQALLVDADSSASDEELQQVPTEAILPGQFVRVPSGRVVPVDGVVTGGRSSVDRSLLSGESRPVGVAPGDLVEAGSLNLGASLTVEAHRAGAETRVGRLMREVERAMASRAPMVAQADRLAGGFTVTVLVLAAVVGVGWGAVTTPAIGVERALALLIVACPCALGLATPLALSAAVSQAAQRKQLLFGAETVERLARASVVLLDKTGTLTEGKLSVVDFRGDPEVLSLVAEAEREAHHPVGRALVDYCAPRASPPFRGALAIEEVVGRGLQVEREDEVWLIGSRAFVESQLTEPPSPELRGGGGGALSPIWVARNGRLAAVFWLGDKVRPDAALSLARLRKFGHRLVLLSGDDPQAVTAVAEILTEQSGQPDLFDEVLGGASPEQKLEEVRRRQASAQPGRDQVVMVGDGVNDAAALAAADVGVAVQGAAEASQLSADAFLAKPGVSELVSLFEGGRRTLLTIRRGIGFSLAYNLFGVSLAASGLLGALGAAILMPLSSLTVVTNAYRSRMFAQRNRPSQATEDPS